MMIGPLNILHLPLSSWLTCSCTGLTLMICIVDDYRFNFFGINGESNGLAGSF